VTWVPIAAWGAAAFIALAVLGFCAYEIMWKARRLERDLGRLQTMTGELADLQSRLALAQQRVVAARQR
jgi:hypothetical protein